MIALLEDHGFAVYICSGGRQDFVRSIADGMYGSAAATGLPRRAVVGAVADLAPQMDGG
jgi:hypothetical protein